MTNFFKTPAATFTSMWYCILVSVSLSVFFTSCSTIKANTYFKSVKNDTVISVKNAKADEMKIKSGDILSIGVSSLNRDEDQVFNAGEQGGYEVGSDGNIFFHRLGAVAAQGFTRKQLKLKLEESLKPYLKDALVSVNFVNHHITVIGDIGTPHILPMPKESISIIDAIAQSGNATQTAHLARILIIRDSTETEKLFKHINLEDHSVFASDYYYLKPNDVVVLNPDEKLVRQQKSKERYQDFSTIFLQIVTTALLIYNSFFRR